MTPDDSRAVRGGSRFRPDIQGLRAVAVLLVVAYHCGVPHLAGGYVGVDAFFVISGFLITRQLATELERDRRLSFRSFYARRARRILPAAALVTVTTVVASSLLMSPLSAAAVDRDGLAASLFSMNYRLAVEASNYLTSGALRSPLQHYWSLSVEEQFYVVWPAVLLVASFAWLKRRPSMSGVFATLLVIAAGSLVLSIVLTSRSPEWAYYSLWSRAWELAAGGLIGLGAARLGRLPRSAVLALGWGGLAAVVAAAVLYSAATPFPSWRALLPVLGAGAVIAAGCSAATPGGRVESFLALRPLQAGGRWSYSWYLWHFPMLVLVPLALGYSLSLPGRLCLAAISLGLAAATYRFVEEPVRSARRLVSRPVLALGVGATLIVSTISVSVGAAAALPSLAGTGKASELADAVQLTPALLRRELRAGLETRKVPSNLVPTISGAADDLPLVYGDGCHASYASTSNPPCIFGDVHSHFTVLLYGDSHAAQWFPAMDRISRREHWRLVFLGKSGCPPLDVTMTRGPGVIAYPQCSRWRAATERRIARLRPDVILVSWDRYLSHRATAEPGVPDRYGSPWLNGLAEMYTHLDATGAKVIEIGATPQFSRVVPKCLSTHLTDASKCDARRSRVIPDPSLGAREDAVAAARHVPVIDPISWFCVDKCPVIVGNILVYRDADHMVPQWSRLISPLLGDRLRSLLSA